VQRKLVWRQKKLYDEGCNEAAVIMQRDMNAEVGTLLEGCFGSIPAQLLRHKLAKKKNKQYCGIIRSVAMTLCNDVEVPTYILCNLAGIVE